jgi:hypothetical protein
VWFSKPHTTPLKEKQNHTQRLLIKKQNHTQLLLKEKQNHTQRLLIEKQNHTHRQEALCVVLFFF